MILRDFKKEDAKIIAGWIRSEEELYRWSADRFNKYPLSGDDINENYAPQKESGRFFPLTAVDDQGDVLGHFIIRYPREDDDRSVRFGFVIVNPSLRGKGYGKEMLRLGIEYARKRLHSLRIDLGVFENNAGARHCYEAVGFREYGQRKCEMPIGTWNCIDMEINLVKNYRIVNKETYYRNGVFRHFTEDCKCSTSMTARIDVTDLVNYSRQTSTKFYINFLYLLSKVLNSRDDYKMSYLWQSEELICYDSINPIQYIFHEDTETCTPVYTTYYDDYEVFYRNAVNDVECAKKTREYGLDMMNHPNWFDASYISWLSYDSLHIELPDGYLHFAPIINWGKYREENGRLMMPLSVRLNHAIADGFLVANVYRLLEKEMIAFCNDEKKIMTIMTVRRSGMHIVKAEASQVEKIVDMSIRAFETDVNVGGAKGDCPPEFDSIEWHKQMAREGHLYQAMIGNDLVGAAIIFPDETKNSVYIGRIFIDSVYHRKGYGIRLMECIEKNFPCGTEFNLDTPCWNERTNAFYKRLGYRIIKIEDGFVFYQKRKNELMEKLTENMIRIELLSETNFCLGSLDLYNRKQDVNKVYRKIDGEYVLVECRYTEDWDLNKKRSVAKKICSDAYITYLALENEKVVGFIGLLRELSGPYMILDMMQVSSECRGQGIGRRLFEAGKAEAKKAGAQALYISACSSEETIAFYRAMGSELAGNPIKEIAEEEPFDLQMICPVNKERIIYE